MGQRLSATLFDSEAKTQGLNESQVECTLGHGCAFHCPETWSAFVLARAFISKRT